MTQPGTIQPLRPIPAGIAAGALAGAAQTWDLSGLGIYNIGYPGFAGGAVAAPNAAAITTDSTAAIAAAKAAAVTAGGGIVWGGAGFFKAADLPKFTVPAPGTGNLPYAMRGAGVGLTTFMQYGTSLANSLTISNPLFDPNNPSDTGPKWGGFTIDGSNATNDCSGIVIGDVSKLHYDDIVIQNFTGAGAKGWYCYSGYGWTERLTLTGACGVSNCTDGMAFGVGLGTPTGTITTTLVSGTAYTSIAIAAGTLRSLFNGESIVLYTGAGTATQTVTVNGTPAQGATSIPVNSFVAAATYTAGTATVTRGAYGSFDYHDVDLWFRQNGNQNGFISYVPMGKAPNAGGVPAIDRVGAYYRFTGNFQSSTVNTGCVFRAMGNDHVDCTWNVSIEGDGSNTTRHTGIQLDLPSGPYVGGSGTFSLAGTAPAVWAGGNYQFSVAGDKVNVGGITTSTNPSGFNTARIAKYIQRILHNNPSVGTGGGNNYPSVIASGVSFQNVIQPDGQKTDLDVIVPITFTGACTVSLNFGTFSGIGVGQVLMAGTAGMTLPLPFKHYADYWARIDLGTPANATIGVPFPQFD